MSSSGEVRGFRLARGNLLESRAHALVNTVNCVGVMGKGIALDFKRKYPEMYRDYVKRCNAGEVRLGEPYIYRAGEHLIVNFPTKDHWRSVSRLADIERGLVFLESHIQEWGIRSIAVPPLGCGNGQLEWSVVGPTLHRHLRAFDIPVDLYVPHDVEPDQEQLSLLEAEPSAADKTTSSARIDPAWLALVEILRRIEEEPYHWPVGRILFQKIAYFATVAGLPTGLQYHANEFGPYAPDLNRMIGRLQNNGLVQEARHGEMIETVVGRTFHDARTKYAADLSAWEDIVSRVTDLMARFNSRRAEVAGSVHYTAQRLLEKYDRPPTATEVIDAVKKWKANRRPPIETGDIARAIVELAVQGWIAVAPDSSIERAVEELTGV